MRILIAALLIIGASVTVSAQDYMLKLTLKKGQRFSLSTAMDLDMTTEVMGQPMAVKTKFGFKYDEEVISISADGSYRLELTFTQIGMTMSGAGAHMSYDSDIKKASKDDFSEMLRQVIDPLIKRKFYAVVSSTGKVTSIEGLKELVDSVSVGMDPTKVQILKNLMDEDKLKSSLQSSYGYLPDHKIKIGDSWTQNIKMTITIPVTTDMTYTLKEVKGNIAKLAVTGESHAKEDSTQVSGVTMKMDMLTHMTGTAELDMTTGIFTSAKTNIDMKGTMEAMGTAMPLTAKGTSETTLISRK